MKMSTLVDRLSEAGLADVQTILQSGNVVFHSDERKRETLERVIEDVVTESFGFQTAAFVRSAEEWRSVIDRNPFPAESTSDPGHLLVIVLKDAPPAPAWLALERAITGRERVRPGDRHGYAVYPDGVGRSRLTSERIERALGTRSTSRNWNTVTKLASLLPA